MPETTIRSARSTVMLAANPVVARRFCEVFGTTPTPDNDPVVEEDVTVTFVIDPEILWTGFEFKFVWHLLVSYPGF